MIIILSPAKTFNFVASPYDTIPVFIDDAHSLIKQLQTRPIKRLMAEMKISRSLAEKTKALYMSFGHLKTSAIHGYNGHQYRHFDVSSLEDSGLKENIKCIYILSGLYGLVKAYDGISPYRLEMKDKTIFNLYEYWQPKLHEFIKNTFKNELIYNLASDEYGQLIKDLKNVITIQFFMFKHGKLSIHSMEAKRMRGLFARYLVMYPHVDIKGIKLEGYTYSILHSTSTNYIFIRTII